MCCWKRPISTSLIPNFQKDDILLALKLIFQPWKWKGKDTEKVLEEEFKRYLKVNYAFSFINGRIAFLAILKALGIKKGDEILVQGFTCNALISPILFLGAKPVFVDVDDTINMDPVDLKRKITKKSKAIVVQHTFGWPAKIDEIRQIARENNLFLIEDCAHSLGAEYKGKKIGTLGDCAFFSFGRDKIISSIFGGMAVTNKNEIAQKLKEIQQNGKNPSSFWIIQQLLYPIILRIVILPAYNIHSLLGRILFGIFHKSSILGKAVSKKEKKGEEKYFFQKMPSALASIALNQFKKLKCFNEHRREIAEFYKRELRDEHFFLPLGIKEENIYAVFMRFPVLVDLSTDMLLRESRKERMYLNDGWRKTPVVPPDTDISKMGYFSGACPKAEKIAERLINLPTHINITQKEAQKIVAFLRKQKQENKKYGDK